MSTRVRALRSYSTFSRGDEFDIASNCVRALVRLGYVEEVKSGETAKAPEAKKAPAKTAKATKTRTSKGAK